MTSIISTQGVYCFTSNLIAHREDLKGKSAIKQKGQTKDGGESPKEKGKINNRRHYFVNSINIMASHFLFLNR